MSARAQLITHPSDPNLGMFVLDAMADDIEDLASIMRYLREWRAWWPHNFTEQEVLSTLASLLEEELVEAYDAQPGIEGLQHVALAVTDDASLRRYWFRPTAKGRLLWEKWDAPLLPE